MDGKLRHHALNYVELTVTDLKAAKDFYSAAFGWKFVDYGEQYAGILMPEAGTEESGGLLLDLAGRREEVLAHDEAAVRGINEWHRVSPRKHPYESHQPAGELDSIIRGRAEELEKFLDWLGTAEGYLLGQGLGENRLAAVRELARREDP